MEDFYFVCGDDQDIVYLAHQKSDEIVDIIWQNELGFFHTTYPIVTVTQYLKDNTWTKVNV